MYSHAVPSDESATVAPETDLSIPWQRGATRLVPTTEPGLAGRVGELPQATGHVPATLDKVSVALLVSDLLALLMAAVFLPVAPAASAVLLVGMLATFSAASLYKSRLTLSILDDIPVIVAAIPALFGIVALTGLATEHPTALLLNGAGMLVLLLVGRTVTYAVIRLSRKRGWVTHRALIVGSGRTSALVARLLDEHPEHGLRVVGFVGPGEEEIAGVRDRVVAADCRNLVETARSQQASAVLVALDDVASEEILRVLRTSDSGMPFTLFVVPRLHELMHARSEERLGHMAVIRLRTSPFHTLSRLLKRALDIMVSAVCIIVLAPLLLAIAAAVRLDMGPGVLFRQTRVGRENTPFLLYKFRSLQPVNQQESEERWSVQNEVRITRVGRFLRKSSLDELPQLFNILRGDMSLVGPRPERPHFVEQFGQMYDWYAFRHRMRPGLTGWAAVNGLRGDTSIEDRCFYDNAYIDNWSLWLDMKILARTVTAVVRGEGG